MEKDFWLTTDRTKGGMMPVPVVLMREYRADIYGLEIRVLRFTETDSLTEHQTVQVRRSCQTWGEATPLQVVS